MKFSLLLALPSVFWVSQLWASSLTLLLPWLRAAPAAVPSSSVSQAKTKSLPQNCMFCHIRVSKRRKVIVTSGHYLSCGSNGHCLILIPNSVYLAAAFKKITFFCFRIQSCGQKMDGREQAHFRDHSVTPMLEIVAMDKSVLLSVTSECHHC